MEGENEFGFEPGREYLTARALAARASVDKDGASGDGDSSSVDSQQAASEVQKQASRQAELSGLSPKGSVSSGSSGRTSQPGPGPLPPPAPMATDPSLPSEPLPQTFQVKYLGESEAGGLWGIKHTRRPVDLLVRAAKELKSGQVLPLCRLCISQTQVSLHPLDVSVGKPINFPIADISYGVQDLVYTRVFCMIVVKAMTVRAGDVPFRCHAFVCESRNQARKVTYTLATAFREYSKEIQSRNETNQNKTNGVPNQKFAIDIRSPEEIEAQLVAELDSEA